VQIKNKWVLAIGSCCAKKCLEEMNTPNTKCIKENGFVKLIDDENIKYINCGSKGELNLLLLTRDREDVERQSRLSRFFETSRSILIQHSQSGSSFNYVAK